MTNIVLSADPQALQLDMPVEIAFRELDDDITLPLFRLVNGVSATTTPVIATNWSRRQ